MPNTPACDAVRAGALYWQDEDAWVGRRPAMRRKMSGERCAGEECEVRADKTAFDAVGDARPMDDAGGPTGIDGRHRLRLMSSRIQCF